MFESKTKEIETKINKTKQKKRKEKQNKPWKGDIFPTQNPIQNAKIRLFHTLEKSKKKNIKILFL